MFATKSNQTNIQHNKIVLATAIPVTKTHLKEFQRQKTSCQTAPKPQLRNFWETFFANARCGVARLSFRLADDQKLQTTQRSWDKNMINSGYWRCVAWCSFKKSDWLACLAATFMHVCGRLWFGDSYSSNLSCEMRKSCLANWCLVDLVGKRLIIATEALVMLVFTDINHPWIWSDIYRCFWNHLSNQLPKFLLQKWTDY